MPRYVVPRHRNALRTRRLRAGERRAGVSGYSDRVPAPPRVRLWPRLPRAGGESPSLEGFKNRVDVAPGDMVEQAWWGWVGGWT